ncbi:MAG: hypothetical protein ACOZIN_16085 [Myxococcota bacterium]
MASPLRVLVVGVFTSTIASLFACGGGLTCDEGFTAVNGRCEAPGSIHGQIVLQGANSAAGIIVHAAGPVVASAASSSNGEFLVKNLPDGAYVISFTGSIAERATLSAVVAGGQVEKGTINLTAVGSVRGQVILEGATTQEGAIVRVAGHSAATSTDVLGNYTLDGVPASPADLLVTAEGYTPAKVTVVVSFGQTETAPTATLTRALSGATATLRGVATLLGRTDHSGITVRLMGTEFSTTTATNGTYSIPSVPAGVYTLVGSAAGMGDDILRDVVVTGPDVMAPNLQLRVGRRIAEAPLAAMNPQLTPDGSRVFFLDSSYSFRSVSPSGSGVASVELPYVGTAPSLTSDGAYATYLWSATSGSEVRWAPVAGGPGGSLAIGGEGVAGFSFHGTSWLVCRRETATAPFTYSMVSVQVAGSAVNTLLSNLTLCPTRLASPDGTSVAFIDTGALKVVPMSGGAPVTVQASGVTNLQVWSTDSKTVVYTGNFGSGVELQAATSPVFAPTPLGLGFFPIYQATTSSVLTFSGGNYLRIMLNGSGTTTLLPNTGLCGTPRLDDGGANLYYRTCTPSALHVLPVGGTSGLLATGVDTWYPNIAPDGSTFILSAGSIYSVKPGAQPVAISPPSGSSWTTPVLLPSGSGVLTRQTNTSTLYHLPIGGPPSQALTLDLAVTNMLAPTTGNSRTVVYVRRSGAYPDSQRDGLYAATLP